MPDVYPSVDRSSAPQSLAEMLERNWWVIGLRGLLAVILGLCAFLFTGTAILSLVLLFSVFAFIDGAVALTGAVRAAKHHRHWTLLALQGAASLVAAAIAFAWPGLTVLAFILVLAAWSLISGGATIAIAVGTSGSQRWWMLLGGMLSVLFGCALVLAPIVGAVVLTWWLGAFALVFGISLIALAFSLRSRLQGARTGTPAHAYPFI